MTQPNNGNPIDLEFYKVKRPRSQKQIEASRRNGLAPKRNTGTPRGFQVIDKDKAKEIQSKGGATSGGNIQAYNEKRKRNE